MILARKISTLALSIYTLTLPTIILLLNLAQLGIPTTISKLISKQKYNRFKIMQVSFFILLLADLLIGILYIFFVPTIANILLKNSYTLLTLYGVVLLLPLVSISSLLKGYFIGIDEVNKASTCQISEEIARIFFILLFINFISSDNVSFLSFFALLSSIIGEIASILHMCFSFTFCLKDKFPILKQNNSINPKIAKEIIITSSFTNSTRIIGSIVYFIEPILYTTFMLKANVPKEELTLSYGIINGYVFPLLMLPTFFSNILSSYLLPKLSKSVAKYQYKTSLHYFTLTLISSFILGAIFLAIICINPSFFMYLLYGKNEGISYIRKYAFFFTLLFIQAPIHTSLIAFNKEKMLLFESILCNIIRILGFCSLIYRFQIDGLIFSILLSVYVSILMHIITLFNSFKMLKNKEQFGSRIKT